MTNTVEIAATCDCAYQPGDSGHEFGCPERHTDDMDCMCEDCQAQEEWMRACDTCGAPDALVRQGFINAFYECQTCHATWL